MAKEIRDCITGEWTGPYPHHAGDYCGNYHPDSQSFASKSVDKAWLAKMRFGLPRPCAAGSTEEMKAQGLVGLYLREDEKRLFDWEREIPTPDELKEPTGVA
jgi:hypothetical protein